MKIIKKVTTVITVIIGLVVAGLLFIQISPNYALYFVQSGSMVPALKPGDIVITGPVGGWLTGQLEPGKVITFQDDKAIVTHRILEIYDGVITTKGDANDDRDFRPLAESNVLGIELFSLPWLGYINGFVSSRRGWFLVIIIPTVLLVVFIVKDIIKESFKGDKTENREAKGGEVIGERK